MASGGLSALKSIIGLAMLLGGPPQAVVAASEQSERIDPTFHAAQLLVPPDIGDPESITITAERVLPPPPPNIGDPASITITAERVLPPPPPDIGDPASITITAEHMLPPRDCEQPRKDLAEARSLADKGSLAAARQALDKIKSEQCPELGPQIDAERTRISGLVDNAIKNAEAALDACSFENSRNLIGALPEGPRQAALVARWNKAYEGEDRARKLVRQAIALRDQGKLIEALAMLREAREAAVCKGSPEVIDRTIANVEGTIAEAVEAALSTCAFKKSRELIDALPQGPRRTALVARWNKTYEAERRARDLANEAVALLKRGEPGKAIGILHEARDLTTCDRTVAAIDKAVVQIGKVAAPSAADQIAAATANCQRDFGGGYRAGDRMPDGRYYCVPDQAAANARCDEINKTTGLEAFNIKNNGSFDCRMGKVAADNWCRAQWGMGWYAVFSEDRSRMNCYPDARARTAQCVREFGAGWRAGDLRRDGRWNCHGPRQQVTTPRAQPGVKCPPGHIPTKSGGCLNLGGIMEGMLAPVRGLTNP